MVFFFLMIRRPPRSTLDRSSAASDVYKRQVYVGSADHNFYAINPDGSQKWVVETGEIIDSAGALPLSLIHISEPTRPY